jgi:copper chaperone NosL
MRPALSKFYEFLDRPLFGWGRVALALLVIPLVLAFTAPLWKISMKAPQYPAGLSMEIYAHKLDGGHGGRDIQEINTLNHYIGMHKIDRAELSELDWMPFALFALVLLTLRCAAIGNVRALVDLMVIAGFVATYSMGRFVYKLYVFGHNLDPKAPFKVEPFTPAIFGEKQIANFHTEAWPQMGSIYIAIFLGGLAAVTLWHLIAGRLAFARSSAAVVA